MSSSLAHLLTDVDGSLSRGSGDDRARLLGRITDLFVRDAPTLSEQQVELFDTVIQRFATAIETRARIELADRLSRIGNGPRGVLLDLAHDLEISVARPVLAHSPRLGDQDLLSVALERGRDHMLAICERPAISETVSDLLVSRGDGVVRHAIVGNLGARFSPISTSVLLEQARTDAALQELLGDRTDLTPDQTARLVEIAKDSARQRLLTSLPGADAAVAGAVERGASALGAHPAPGRDYSAALHAVDGLMASRGLTEQDLAEFASARQLEEAVSALATMTGLSIPSLERIFEERDNDLLLVIGKARGWAWRTVRLLLQLRDPRLTERHHFRRAEETFDGLVTTTAQRVLHFLKVRESTALQGGRVRSG